MQLTSGEFFDRTGTIRGREVILSQNGKEYAKAILVLKDSDDQFPVIWWEPGQAPPDGSRVRIKGKVQKFNGTIQIHARNTLVERTGSTQDPLATIASFYLGCIEAEAARNLRFDLDGKNHILLGGTASPLHSTLKFPGDSPHSPWFKTLQGAIGETLLSGWPIVLGTDPETDENDLIGTPLLIAETEFGSTDDEWWIQYLGAGADLNPFALDLLGLDRQQRDEMMAAVATNVAVEEATTSATRSKTILQVLRQEGIDGLNELDPSTLASLRAAKGIHNAGVVMTYTGTSGTIRSLSEDLGQLANYPELLSEGPAAILLGNSQAPETPFPAPHPVISLSSLQQDTAVHSAMVNDFTVVTGPPGTGKSQVLVNVVAAAVAKGETILFASKNNRAVDVVVERLRSASPNAVVVRAGSAGKRNEVAEYISTALSAKPETMDLSDARHAWRDVEKSLQSIYGVLHERSRIETELQDRGNKLQEALDHLPPDTETEVSFPELDSALSDTCEALDAFGDSLWLFFRWRRHRRRLGNARLALDRVGNLLNMSRTDLEKCLTSVADRPKRSLAPRQAFRTIENIASEVREIAKHRIQMSELRARLSELPSKHELDDRLNALQKERIETGTKFLDMRWMELRQQNTAALTAARDLAELLKREFKDRIVRQTAYRTLPEALPVLPVWATTNLSVRTNLPLKPGLFDLVVIDEASQCDVASALPLLVRGKRALIIGDQKQLVHITSLSNSREQIIARKRGLTDLQSSEFSYRNRSCFGLASSRLNTEPIFLDLHFRSHPAIVNFSNENFYGGRLELCSTSTPPKGLKPIEWIRVAGNCEQGPKGRSRLNVEEANRVVQSIIHNFPTYKGLGCSVGVVTPYSAQVDKISNLLMKLPNSDDFEQIKVATVHSYQGDERDIIYFSPVIDRSMAAYQVRFASDPNLINVTITRARRRLIIVGDPDACLAHDNALKELATYSLNLAATVFDSPLELNLYLALQEKGIEAKTGVVVGKHRLDLAIEHGDIRLDVECDGAAFHTDYEQDISRDRALESEGWIVMRFSGRTISRDLDACVKEIADRVGYFLQ